MKRYFRKYYFSVSVVSRVDDMHYIYTPNSIFDQDLWRKKTPYRKYPTPRDIWLTYLVILPFAAVWGHRKFPFGIKEEKVPQDMQHYKKDSYFCVIWIIVVAVLVSIHCLTSTDVRKCRKVRPARWGQECSGKA